MPLGANAVTVTVDDGHGHTAQAAAKVVVQDTTPPLVTAPAALTIPATQAAGAQAGNSSVLLSFLSGGSATDQVDPAPARLADTSAGVAIDANTIFPLGVTKPVTFSFHDASGNFGSATSSVTVILGQPKLYGRVTGQGSSSAGFYVDVTVSNTGTGNARNVTITQIAARTISGTGSVTVASTLPISVGNLDVGVSTTVRIFLNVPSTVTRFSITDSGPAQDVVSTNYTYSISLSIIP
jgi:hypothetical protein